MHHRQGADARPALGAEDDRRAEPLDAVHQAAAREAGRHLAAALDEQSPRPSSVKAWSAASVQGGRLAGGGTSADRTPGQQVRRGLRR